MRNTFTRLAVSAMLWLILADLLPPASAFSISTRTFRSSERDYLNPNTGRFWSMDSYNGNNQDPQSLHKYLYGADNPVNLVDPSGNKTVIVVTDAENKGSGDQKVADKAATHLQKAGWSVIDIQADDFLNIKSPFEGVIFSGHGDSTQSAAITVDVLESKLNKVGSKLDVAMALSCHGFDFITKVSRDGYTTSTALVIGYWGYAINTVGKNYRIGKAVDKWNADPTYTCLSYGNLLADGFGMAAIGIRNTAVSGSGSFFNSIFSIGFSFGF